MNEAFFLKYRPQKVGELDLIDVRQGLLKILKSGKVPHALLFAGPRGTGKTSAARIIAKVVNCQKRKGKKLAEPCNRCWACLQITAGTALDLIEIDAASTRGIDDIRNLREKVKLAPTQLKNKVYIIDEVHMLTTEAFNALLKTLEEPPANTIFILCTTAPEKLPATIISRCTRFNFQKGRVEEVMTAVKRVVKGEKLKVEKGVLEEIAKAVDGSFRDGQKILDQLAAGRKKVTLKETKELLGRIETLSSKKLLSLLAGKELKKSLLEVDRIVTTGGDLAVYSQELLERLRLGLLAKAGLSEINEPEETKNLDINQLRFLLELFSKAANQIKTNPIPQLPLELVVVEWCGGEGEKSEDRKQKTENESNPAPKSKKGKLKLEEVKGRWLEVLAGIRPLNYSVEALLRATRPVDINGEVLTLEVFYRFHKERLEEDRCRRIVEEVANQIFGIPIKLKCVLGQRDRVAKSQSDKEIETAEESDIIRTAEEIFETNAD